MPWNFPPARSCLFRVAIRLFDEFATVSYRRGIARYAFLKQVCLLKGDAWRISLALLMAGATPSPSTIHCLKHDMLSTLVDMFVIHMWRNRKMHEMLTCHRNWGALLLDTLCLTKSQYRRVISQASLRFRCAWHAWNLYGFRDFLLHAPALQSPTASQLCFWNF